MSISQRNYQRRASDLETVGSAPSSPDKRSKLHNSSTIHWLQRRHQNTANLNYLLLPEEIQTHLEVQDVFDLIDADKSGKLALHEFYDMLRQANIKIGKNDLKNFYRKVDDDCDTALDFKEFKNCTLSEEANLHFSKMMENVRKAYENDPIRLKAKLKTQKTMPKEKARDDKEPKEESKDPESDMPFLPRTFGTLLNYLAYLSKKKDMVDFINDKSNDYEKKFQKFGDLIDLQMDKDIYLEQYNSKLHRSPTLMSSGGFTARSQPESVRARRSISQDDKMDTKKLFPELSTAKANNFNNSIKEEQFLIKLDEMAQKTRQTVKSEFYKRRCRGAKLLSSGILSPPSEMEQISLSTHKESARVPWKNSSRITKGFQSAATSPHGANEEYEDGFPSPRRTVKKLSSGLLNNDFGSHGVPLGEDKESRLLDRRDYGINDSNLRITKDVFELRNDLQARLKPTDHVIEDEDEDKKGSLAGLRSLRKIMTSKMGDYQANCYSAASSPRLSIQQIQSYRETPQRNEFASSDVYSQQPAPVQTKSSKMPFNYDSVCPTFDYYCNSTNPNGIRSLRKRSKTKAIFVGVGTPSVKIQPESARGLPSYPLRNLSPKVEEPPLKKNGSHAKTVLNPLTSFQENLAMKLQVALGKGVKRKTKLQLQGEKIQPASLDASIRRK